MTNMDIIWVWIVNPKIGLLWDCLTSTLYLILMRLLTWTGGRMLSSNGKELDCAASSCQKTRRMILIWPPNICLWLLLTVNIEVGQVLTLMVTSIMHIHSVYCKVYDLRSHRFHTFSKSMSSLWTKLILRLWQVWVHTITLFQFTKVVFICLLTLVFWQDSPFPLFYPFLPFHQM